MIIKFKKLRKTRNTQSPLARVTPFVKESTARVASAVVGDVSLGLHRFDVRNDELYNPLQSGLGGPLQPHCNAEPQ